MIDGLKLTMTGEQIRTILVDRIEQRKRSAQAWREDAGKPNEERPEPSCWLPREMCLNAANRAEWRAARLQFIYDHIDPSEVYLLGRRDLKFGELNPSKPAPVESCDAVGAD